MPVTTVYEDCTDCCLETIGEECCECDDSPAGWAFELVGITNEDCLDCDDFNRAWILDYTPATCQWTTDPLDPPPTECTGGSDIELNCNSTDWVLSFTMSFGEVLYTKTIATWDCLGSNILTLASNTQTECQGWPDTITVVPVNVP